MAERSPHPDIDDAIDRAVRAVMDVDPLPGFDQRVIRRLEQPRRRAFAWPRFAAAAAALATMLIIAVVLRDGPSQPNPDVTRSNKISRTPSVTPASTGNRTQNPTAASPTSSTAQGARGRSTTERRGPVVMAAPKSEVQRAEPPIATLAALDPPSALAVANIEQRPVNIPAIDLSRIEIGELNVQPLPGPDQGGKE